MSPALQSDATVHVVDDDDSMRRSVVFLAESVGWRARGFVDAESFLAQADCSAVGCLVLDIRMPAMSGLELQQVLQERGIGIPILFITGHADISMAVQALKSGAADFIEKPFEDQVLLDAVATAVRRSAQALEESQARARARAALDTLSPREREVARLVAQGQPNKAVAALLGISEKTVHIHRHHVMRKVDISSAAELARLMLKADPAALD